MMPVGMCSCRTWDEVGGPLSPAVGVDGCRYGWIAVTREGASLHYRLFASMRELLAFHADASRVLVDIPIGLA